jgi:hypothetical protein
MTCKLLEMLAEMVGQVNVHRDQIKTWHTDGHTAHIEYEVNGKTYRLTLTSPERRAHKFQ